MAARKDEQQCDANRQNMTKAQAHEPSADRPPPKIEGYSIGLSWMSQLGRGAHAEFLTDVTFGPQCVSSVAVQAVDDGPP